MINFFDFLDKQNEEDEKAHIFDINLKNWAGIAGSKGVKLPEFMSEEELKKFLDAIENADFKNNTIRNKLIIKIIIFTGIRVSEAINIKMGDISEENDLYIIRIRAKGNKYRVVMIKELIYDLLKNVSINYMSKDALLFVNKRHSTDSILCQSHSRTAFISCRNSQTKKWCSYVASYFCHPAL